MSPIEGTARAWCRVEVAAPAVLLSALDLLVGTKWGIWEAVLPGACALSFLLVMAHIEGKRRERFYARLAEMLQEELVARSESMLAVQTHSRVVTLTKMEGVRRG